MVFALPEYERATSTAVYTALSELARARSPLLAEIPQDSVTELPISRLSDDSGETLELEPVAVKVPVEFEIDAVIVGDLSPVLAGVSAAAETHKEALMKAFIETMGKVTDFTGNKLDAKGQPWSWDLLTDMLEQVEMDFDDEGNPKSTLIMNPRDVEKLQALPPPTPEQDARREAVMARKREEWRKRQRTRRLR